MHDSEAETVSGSMLAGALEWGQPKKAKIFLVMMNGIEMEFIGLA